MTSRHLSCRPSNTADALIEADRLCERRGAKLTPIRRLVLSMLLEANRPTKAYDLLPRLRADGEAKPPTLYRALDFLIETGLAHRIESLNSYVACGHWRHGHSAVFLVCDRCGFASELHVPASLKKLGHEAEAAKFRMRRAIVEVCGVCKQCQ